MSFLKLENVTKVYHSAAGDYTALKDLSFELENGEFVVILGPSGAGKTTLLNLLGGMDNATQGSIALAEKEITHLNKKELTQYRRQDVGFIFQFYNLMANLTAKENVELATEICKDALDPVKTLESVGLGERLLNFPPQLSGGEQQRVSIARAIAKNPKLLLCDEPTGALDYNTSREILRLIEKISLQYGTTIIMVTHNEAIGAMADTVTRLRDGSIRDRTVNVTRMPADQLEW